MSGTMGAATPGAGAGRPRFALVGCGDFGKHLARYAVEQAELAALCDPDAGNLAATATELGAEVPGYGDYRELLRRERLDAVLVTAANHVHAEITVAAAEARVHVFCEKAMARTARECWDMVAACRRHGVKLMVGHKRRLRPPWARMVELTGDDLLGAPLSITVAQYTDNRPYEFFDTWWSDPACGGGFLHMHGVHVIDWFRAMCGDARDVHAVYGPQHDPRYGFRDVLHATYRFHSGAVATIAGGLSFPLHQFRESQGPWGECRHGGFKLVPALDHIDLYWQRLDAPAARHERFDDLGFDHAYRREIGDFFRWIGTGAEPCLTWVEGLRCVEMMEGAYRSAQQEGRVVEFPLHPELEP
ncbi:MAG: Gfo/Idh/MocA family oxidoreductase [Spirochaetaceae bacterium]|nr:Gfo/Idh/MocA family oxidoreductase [Spirochaetaceae bacterium]